uniref:TctD-like protein n=1 Tax=Polysiphonia sertularioides TaxID=945028 RepID=A0A1Z1MH37_9FLOR|nr:hypothetical protein [Polysiphonia sertularioides]
MKKILLVDDDKNLCTLLSSYLTSFGFIVNSSNNIYDALVSVRKQSPDLVISDIMMKDLNGYDLIRLLNLNDIFTSIPFIFLTAKGLTSDRIKGYNLGCYAYVTKPFDPKELVAIINNILVHLDTIGKKKLFLPNRCISNNNLFEALSLTSRERTILDLVLKGYMNKEIAMIINTSNRNVEKYVTRILNKTNVRNRVELIKLFG